MIHYKLFTVSDLISNFGITKGYAQTLLEKLNQRASHKLSINEQRLISIFEKNRLLKK
jgi:hypothetical protein